jgi:hypothetical protein
MYSIEQDAPQARLAYSLQCRANIYSMQVTTLSAQCFIPYTEVSDPLTYDVEWEAQNPVIKVKQLTIPVRFGIRVSSDKQPAVVVNCIIRADYELAPDYQAGSEEIEAFRYSNAIFNCYPYFREFVQNTLSRMNYPPLSIPFLRLVPKPPVQPAKNTVIEHVKALEGETPPDEGESGQKRLASSRPRTGRKRS